MKAANIARQLSGLVMAPIRIRRNPPKPPDGDEHYAIPELAPDADHATTKAADIPVATTPPGGWKTWPPLVLAGCDEPLAPGAPDIRGVWQVVQGPLKGHIERNEQAGNRVVITAAGIIHDMFADGTLTGGVNDEDPRGVPIAVAARFEDGRLNLYLNDKLLVVTRYRDGEHLIWRYGPYKNRLRRLRSAGDAA